MAVFGFNIDPESGDPVIGIEREISNASQVRHACVYIDESEIFLSREELAVFISQARRVLTQMEWDEATWAYASGMLTTDTTHLMRKEDDPHERALCGRLPTSWGILGDYQKAWDRSPVLGKPAALKLCKQCIGIYYKEQRKQEEQEQRT